MEGTFGTWRSTFFGLGLTVVVVGGALAIALW